MKVKQSYSREYEQLNRIIKDTAAVFKIMILMYFFKFKINQISISHLNSFKLNDG